MPRSLVGLPTAKLNPFPARLPQRRASPYPRGSSPPGAANLLRAPSRHRAPPLLRASPRCLEPPLHAYPRLQAPTPSFRSLFAAGRHPLLASLLATGHRPIPAAGRPPSGSIAQHHRLHTSSYCFTREVLASCTRRIRPSPFVHLRQSRSFTTATNSHSTLPPQSRASMTPLSTPHEASKEVQFRTLNTQEDPAIPCRHVCSDNHRHHSASSRWGSAMTVSSSPTPDTLETYHSICGSTQHNKRKHSENPQDSSYVKAAKRSRKKTQGAGMAQDQPPKTTRKASNKGRKTSQQASPSSQPTTGSQPATSQPIQISQPAPRAPAATAPRAPAATAPRAPAAQRAPEAARAPAAQRAPGGTRAPRPFMAPRSSNSQPSTSQVPAYGDGRLEWLLTGRRG